MDKQALIDKAVEQLSGVWLAHWVTAVYDVKSGSFSSWPPRRKSETLKHVCTPEEFEQRARELGWVNGYLWGRDYPTNGKRPDLPDGVVFELYDVTFEWLPFGYPNNDVHPSIIENCTKFRITDLRYKPKQPESHSKTSVDNSWHEKGELPPAGTECVIFPRCDKARITYMGNGVACYVDLSNGVEYSCATSSFEFRPIKTEKEKFVIAAKLITDIAATDRVFEILFEAGCRFVD